MRTVLDSGLCKFVSLRYELPSALAAVAIPTEEELEAERKRKGDDQVKLYFSVVFFTVFRILSLIYNPWDDENNLRRRGGC